MSAFPSRRWGELLPAVHTTHADVNAGTCSYIKTSLHEGTVQEGQSLSEQPDNEKAEKLADLVGN